MREDTRKWVDFANMDLKLAILAMNDGIYVYSAYHAQQSVEKFLKAILIENGKFHTRTHDIKFLINLCKEIDEEFKKLSEIEADKLTFYATKTRYPEVEYEVSREEAI